MADAIRIEIDDGEVRAVLGRLIRPGMYLNSCVFHDAGL